MKEQLDPTVYTVLTAKSKIPGVSLTEFAVFTPKWLNTQDTFRPPVRSLCFETAAQKSKLRYSIIIGIWPQKLEDLYTGNMLEA